MSTTQTQQQSRPSLPEDVSLAPTLPFVGGRWVQGSSSIPVLDKYSGQPFAEVSGLSPEQVREAVRAARKAFEAGVPAPHERAAALRKCAGLIDKSRKRFVSHLVAEAGFTLPDANTEVDRAIVTLNLSAEEATRMVGEQVAFAATLGQENRIGFTIRVPLGTVCAITPFNSPLNTVVHKVGPALAGGNAVLLKPAGYTPLTAALLVEALLEAGVPTGLISLIQGRGATAGNALLEDQDISFYAFTGSTEIGMLLLRGAGLRRTQLELGSISSTIVCNDADLARAVPKIANASFRKAGQVCTSIQRLYVETNVLDRLMESLTREVGRMPAGDPRDPATRVGPLISEWDAERVENWIREAVEGGAQLVCGGQRSGRVVQPAILANVRRGMKVLEQEIFGPVLCVIPFKDFEEAVAGANDQPYGLAVGIFTRDVARALQAARSLRFGGIHINETSSSRVDGMPYGGLKASGYGLEGPKYAIQEMTEQRLVTISPYS